ncbi:L-aspartate oxidase [Lignipirellula cremea]|uniref:L-aspartate oxidase n=1 Tax=Lignipirellula cremea TaxID=2528010 RepID=A0A518E4Q6_9BACT|nr:L-aspartate oxidase [Lignipirellula cremea]QDU99067.1 L-aspartate oxidase [Lignipirellula cremea]
MTPRYLVSFHPKRMPHYFADVLIIGGGLAGLRAANGIDPRLSVLVVTKDVLRQSNSNYAQGGIAGVLDPADRFEEHVDDTLVAGGELCDRAIVEKVIRQAPACIKELIQWGVQFDEEEGALMLGREGGHSRHRIVHALGDATGKEVMRGVIERTKRLPNVQIWENAFTLDLLTHENVCRGALIATHDQKTLVWAKQTILCTGGAGQIYRETTNPPVATADGHALAYRAGAELRDMEFMQFHPTVLYIAGSSRSLITEAMRGEGAWLVDRNDHRFMLDYDERGELAPRDVVSQAIVSQMEKTRHPSVYLDLSHLDAAYVRKRFPGIAESCAKFGLDITSDRIPVRPGAHYMIGGVTVDDEGRTSVANLWAAGEVTSSGLHGANRLASNSLLEGLVYGALAGAGASAAAAAMPDDFQALPLSNPLAPAPEEPLDIVDISNSLKSLMWRSAAVRRNRADLGEAMRTIDAWRRYVLALQFDEAAGWELQNMLSVSRIVVLAAMAREESRGVHLRTDFPDVDNENWARHQTFTRSSRPTGA